MSGKLRLNGATSGYIELQAEDEANNSTLTISNDGFGGGKILQVKSVTKKDSFSTGDNSWTDITGLSLTITPSKATSKILVQASLSAGSQGIHGALRIMGTHDENMFVGDVDSSFSSATRGSWGSYWYDWKVMPVTLMHLDSPNSTSELTYKVQCMDTASGTFVLNRSNYGNYAYKHLCASSFTLWEVGA